MVLKNERNVADRMTKSFEPGQTVHIEVFKDLTYLWPHDQVFCSRETVRIQSICTREIVGIQGYCTRQTVGIQSFLLGTRTVAGTLLPQGTDVVGRHWGASGRASNVPGGRG